MEDTCDTCSEDSKPTGATTPTEDLCDTCSGDSDEDDATWDTVSLCSWTTDQGEFGDFDRHMAAFGAGTDVGVNGLRSPFASGSPVSLDDLSSSDTSVGCSQVVQDGSPMAPPGVNSFLVPMMAVPCVYVVPVGDGGFSPTAETAPFADTYPPHLQQWSQPLGPPPGVWNHSPQLPWRGRTSSQRPKAYKNLPARLHSSGPSKGACNSDKTTIILRSLPIECTRDVLLRILFDEGFGEAFDFLHVPVDFQTWAGLGYALVNFATHEMALRVQAHFDGFARWPFPSDKVCEVAWNGPHQGLSTHIERYRNSPLMHFSVSEIYRPVLYEEGARVRFPAPTARIRAPRIRHQKPETIFE